MWTELQNEKIEEDKREENIAAQASYYTLYSYFRLHGQLYGAGFTKVSFFLFCYIQATHDTNISTIVTEY